MAQKDLSGLKDSELLEQAKKMKHTHIYDAVIIGFLIGIAIYSSVKNGFGLLTFLPLGYLPVAAKNKARKEKIKQLLKNRNLIEGN